MESYFASHQGAQVYGSETLVYDNPSFSTVLNDGFSSFKLPEVQVPAPDIVRRQGLGPPKNFFKEEKCNDAGLTQGLFDAQFSVASQAGYKMSANTEDLNKKRGAPAYSLSKLGMDASVVGEPEVIPGINDPGVKLGYEGINSEKATYKYGLQETAPSLGLEIKGSGSLLLKGSGDKSLKFPTKRAGAFLSGMYAGYQSEDSSITQTLPNGTN